MELCSEQKLNNCFFKMNDKNKTKKSLKFDYIKSINLPYSFMMINDKDYDFYFYHQFHFLLFRMKVFIVLF